MLNSILRSSLIIAGAQAANVLLGVLRLKIVAILLGPVGVALLDALQNLRDLGALGASLGFNISGVRQVAAEKSDTPRQKITVRTVFISLFWQGILGGLIVWLFHAPLARFITTDGMGINTLAIVGLAVALMTFSYAQVAILQGLRFVKQYAVVVIFSAFVTTGMGSIFVLIFGLSGLVSFVVLQPASMILASLFFIKKHVPYPISILNMEASLQIWKQMAKLGSTIMIGAMAMPLTLLLTRQLIAEQYSIFEAGLFSAAWILTIYYIGFLLSAMGADYFPRLSEIITDHKKVAKVINLQAQVALTIGGPLILLLVGYPELILNILYTKEFEAAAHILQWQAIGNLFKICSWSIGFAILAAARSNIYLVLQIHWNLLFFGLIWVFLPRYGLEVTGVSFLVAYISQFFFSYIVVHHTLQFRLEKRTIMLLVLFSVLALGLLGVSRYDDITARIFTAVFIVATGLIGFTTILRQAKKDPG